MGRCPTFLREKEVSNPQEMKLWSLLLSPLLTLPHGRRRDFSAQWYWKRSCAIWFVALGLLIFKRVHLDVFWAASWQSYRRLWMASCSSDVNESVQLQGEVLGSQLRLIVWAIPSKTVSICDKAHIFSFIYMILCLSTGFELGVWGAWTMEIFIDFFGF